MITKFKADGFKSFQDFEMVFTPLTVIAGANASGKSNLFDALKLLSRLAETDLKTAFSEQRGNPDELFTQYDDDTYADEMSFTVEMFVDRKVKDNWGGEAILNNTRLRYQLKISRSKSSYGFQALRIVHETLEKIKPEEDDWVKSQLPKARKNLWRTLRAGGSREPFIKTEMEDGKLAIRLRQDGGGGQGKVTPALAVSQTVLGGITSVDFPHAFAAKEEMRNWKFLQLNPEDIREPTRQDAGLRDEITYSGKNLAAALYRIQQQDDYALKEISRKLNSLLPNFTDVQVFDDSANRQYIIKIKGEDQKWFSSRVLSEGTLRLLVLCILQYDEKFSGLLCFEEPENGIHPFRIDATAHLLKELSSSFDQDDDPLRQIIVNTHSPVLIRKLGRWRDDKNVSVWFSKQNTLIKSIDDRKARLRVTRVIPVMKTVYSNVVGNAILIPYTNEFENKLTLAEAEKYLMTTDVEEAVNYIKA